MEFLVRGTLEYGEPGVVMSFEESTDDLAQNLRSLGFDLDALVAQNKLAMDFVTIDRGEIEETGEYDLEGLFIRLGLAIDSIGAQRVVLDTVESLFGGLSNPGILRSELRRLFRWLKNKGVTTIITGERGDGQLTRQGLEEYVSDCVILLDHRVNDQLSTRRLRVVKYRGSHHGTNEYPFLIDEQGISVLPVTSLGMRHEASTERMSSGVHQLDRMLGGDGYYRGSSILVSGTAGTGKTSLAAHLADATCSRGELCLYFAFEESEHQMVRNMRSIGIDLEPWIQKGLLLFHASRPMLHGLESHLVTIHKMVRQSKPRVVIVDPLSSFASAGAHHEVHAMLLRLVDFFKAEQITAFFTALLSGGSPLERTELEISSMIDTWLFVRDIETGGERNRGLYVLKSRGMAHSNQIREFRLTDHGVELLEVYSGPEGVLTGSMRTAQEAKERAEAVVRRQERELKQRDLDRRRATLEAQIMALRKEFEAVEHEAKLIASLDQEREDILTGDRAEMTARRGGSPQNQSRPTQHSGPNATPIAKGLRK
jgi:circadian clock protein KaiC